MMTCPHCQKPVSSRVCGYCGASLIENYFGGNAKATAQYPSIQPGNLIATIIAIFGALIILAAGAIQLTAQFLPNYTTPLQLNLEWWSRIIIIFFCGALFFVQQLVLHGLRFSMLFDSCWMFVFISLFGTCILVFIELGISAFYEITLIPWLLMVGSGLCVISCATNIVIFKRPG